MRADTHFSALIMLQMAGTYDFQPVKPKVLHGSGCGAHIAWPLGLHENDADVVEWVHGDPSIGSTLVPHARYGLLTVVGSASAL
jgi:hypothetical protein